MELISLPVSVFSAVAAALLSRAVGKLWLRALIVVAVAYGAAFVSLAVASRFSTDGQFGSWAPLLLRFSFGVGAVVGIGALLVSHRLLKPRRPHAG